MAEHKCNECGQTFNSPNELREHQKSSHKSSKNPKK